MSSDYDSDSDAPEDISFSTGKADAIRDLEITKAERTKQDNSLKEWRRKRDAQYRQQKEKKLSLDVLMKADAEIKRRRIEDDQEVEEDNFSASGSDSEVEEDTLGDGEENREEENAKDENFTEKYEEDLSIAVIDSKGSHPLMQAALDFKSRALYGGRIKRMDMSQVNSRREKRKVTNKIRRQAMKANRAKRRK